MRYISWADVCREMTEQLDTMSSVKSGGFQSRSVLRV